MLHGTVHLYVTPLFSEITELKGSHNCNKTATENLMLQLYCTCENRINKLIPAYIDTVFNTYSTVVDGRSCNLHSRSFGHASVHPWSYYMIHNRPVIPLQT